MVGKSKNVLVPHFIDYILMLNWKFNLALYQVALTHQLDPFTLVPVSDPILWNNIGRQWWGPGVEGKLIKSDKSLLTKFLFSIFGLDKA